MLVITDQWKDYELIDAGDGEKLERWKDIVLRRPDPQAVWPKNPNEKRWQQAHAHYHRSKSGGGQWENKKKLPSTWTIQYKNLCFKVAPTDFKHTGLFPEQASNWDFMQECIQEYDGLRILNLFAYTGGATMACAGAGAEEVVHVDASKGMTQWAKENQKLSRLDKCTVRYMVDDVLKFVEREQRRGRTYHGIVMDPPSYGRGPNGEIWKLENQINELIEKTKVLLDKDARFFLVNAYTTGFSHHVLHNILKLHFPDVELTSGDLALPMSSRDLILPCGIYGRVKF